MDNVNKKSDKKIMILIMGITIMIVISVGVSIAFFNYTCTGFPNSIAVGNIYFNSNYAAVTLTNVFPVDNDVSTTIDTSTHQW